LAKWPEQGFFHGSGKSGIDQLAPTVFFPSLGMKELGAKAVTHSRLFPNPQPLSQVVWDFFLS
jgi:hypothetical protein